MNNITSVKEKVNIETIKNDRIVKLPWVPKLGPKLRKEFKKFDIKTIFLWDVIQRTLNQNCFLIAFLVIIN